LWGQSPALFAGQSRALELLVGGEPFEHVFAALVQAVESDLGGEAVAGILLLDAEGKRLHHGAAPSLPESYNRAIDGIAIAPDFGTCCAAAARNEVVVTVDIASDPNWATIKNLPLGLGLRAAWSMPIRSTAGKVLGTFGIYFRTCRAPTAAEREVVTIMARTAAIAIEHRATTAALHESEGFLQSVIGASADCIKVLDLEGRLQWMSANGLCAMEVADFATICGNEWLTFWQDGPTRSRAQGALGAALEGAVGRFRGLCPTFAGTPKWWDVLVTAIRDDAGQPQSLLCVSRDVTERKSVEEALSASEERYRQLAHDLEARVRQRMIELAATNAQLRREIAERVEAERARQELSQKLDTAEEDERRRISRELHDEVGQNLTALLLGLQSLRNGHLGAAVDDDLRRLERIAEQVGKEIHDVALVLRPTALDDLGLAGALAHIVDQWSTRAQIPIEFHQKPKVLVRLPPAIETTLYRVILEALTNVLKHARARRVSVILEIRPDHALTIIEDDGIGFDLEPALPGGAPPRLGLLGMRERVSLHGGTLSIESKRASGTALFVRIPLPPAEVIHG